MVRKLKYHEQKLLKKTDFITYKQVRNYVATLTNNAVLNSDLDSRTTVIAITRSFDGI